MPWFKVDDGFHDHPKVDELSLEAIGLWTLCGTWSSRHLTDGEVPWNRVQKFGGTPELCSELVRANMWRTSEDVRDGAVPNAIFFTNWGDWNPTKEDVESDRKKARERMKRVRDQGKRSPEQTANERRSSGDVRDPRPVPSKRNIERKIACPNDWKPTTAHIEKALSLGLDVNAEAEAFKNHHGARGTKFVDWGKAFTNWLTKAKEFKDENGWQNKPTGTTNNSNNPWSRKEPF